MFISILLPSSELRIKFKKEYGMFYILFDMISMEIKDQEIKEIFKEGVSGENAKKAEKNGDGLGMAIIDRILKLNDGQLTISKNQGDFQRKVNGIYFVRNV